MSIHATEAFVGKVVSEEAIARTELATRVSAVEEGKQDKLDSYVKDAAKSADGKTLTLTRHDGTTVSFQGGGDGAVIESPTHPGYAANADKADGDENGNRIVDTYSRKDDTEEKVEAAKSELNARIDSIEAMAHPNINIVGSPKFNQGSISGFSANDYLVFPTAVDVGEDHVEFYMSFTTGTNVTTQENILDSWCGLAFAIRNGTTVTATSTDGQSFVGENVGGSISTNSSYRLKIDFWSNSGVYHIDTYLADGGGEYVKVGNGLTASAPLYPTATYWGGANPANGIHHIFGGTINLNACRLDVNGETVWRGYSELNKVSFNPNATPRLDTAEKIVKVVEDAVSLNNRFLVGATSAAIQTRESEEAEWTDEIRVDKGYDALTGETVVKLDKSVQSIVVSGETTSLDIELPDAVDGTVRDICLYVSNTTETDCALNIPDGTYYGDDPNGAVAKAGQVTVLYFTEIPVGAWLLRIVALDQHAKPAEVTA